MVQLNGGSEQVMIRATSLRFPKSFVLLEVEGTTEKKPHSQQLHSLWRREEEDQKFGPFSWALHTLERRAEAEVSGCLFLRTGLKRKRQMRLENRNVI